MLCAHRFVIALDYCCRAVGDRDRRGQRIGTQFGCYCHETSIAGNGRLSVKFCGAGSRLGLGACITAVKQRESGHCGPRLGGGGDLTHLGIIEKPVFSPWLASPDQIRRNVTWLSCRRGHRAWGWPERAQLSIVDSIPGRCRDRIVQLDKACFDVDLNRTRFAELGKEICNIILSFPCLRDNELALQFSDGAGLSAIGFPGCRLDGVLNEPDDFVHQLLLRYAAGHRGCDEIANVIDAGDDIGGKVVCRGNREHAFVDRISELNPSVACCTKEVCPAPWRASHRGAGR